MTSMATMAVMTTPLPSLVATATANTLALQVAEGMYCCGDHTGTATLNGAM
eukprot:CAMPEP_0119534984 /NCGR_PEP_ID=MMETSP1344-20130328/48107_1 /TAXON_ID=236787 /ORGANISM="Florenciella parvula, Strain CCMP2471" /LENGTH=50 /DNA_ID=CAMNT_0007576419 /DNA_START=199 /DNA_END=349 /DNA_ORIENTATION=+